MATAVRVARRGIPSLFSSDYEPDAEYVDGGIEERPRTDFDHASWQYAIQHLAEGACSIDWQKVEELLDSPSHHNFPTRSSVYTVQRLLRECLLSYS